MMKPTKKKAAPMFARYLENNELDKATGGLLKARRPGDWRSGGGSTAPNSSTANGDYDY